MPNHYFSLHRLFLSISFLMRKVAIITMIVAITFGGLVQNVNAQNNHQLSVDSPVKKGNEVNFAIQESADEPVEIDLSNAHEQNGTQNVRLIKNEVLSNFDSTRSKLTKLPEGSSDNSSSEKSENGFFSKALNFIYGKDATSDVVKQNNSKVKFTPDNLIQKPEDIASWRRYHKERVEYLTKHKEVPAVALEKARHARDEFENSLLDKGYISTKYGKVRPFKTSVLDIFSGWFENLIAQVMPQTVYAYLFGEEDFESCSSLPCSFDTNNSWGSVTPSLDSTGKVSGTDSLKEVVTGEGGGGLTSEGHNTDEIYVQFKVFIPSDMTWGASGYNGLLNLYNPSNGEVMRLNLEDWGTARLTMAGGNLSWTNTGIDLTKGAINTLEIRFKKGSSDGDVDIWLNNTSEGSPNYNGSGSLNTGTSNVDDVKIGITYSPEAISTTYFDDVIINDSFIGAGTPANNAPTAPSGLLVENQTNPSGITDVTPEFSAVFNDDAGDLATHYQLQVSTYSNFASTVWDTSSSSLASTTPEGTRIADISYSGTSLASSTTYYWRIKFWDDDGIEGSWSTTTSTFTLGSSGGTTTTAYNIYDDAIHSGWSDYSWSISTDLTNNSPVYQGTYSAEAAYSSAWGGFSYYYGSIDTSQYESLDMAVNVGNNTSVDLYVYFATSSAIQVIPIEYYVSGGFSANTWHEVSIPLYDLGMENFTGAATFNIESSQAVTVYYDDIKFKGVTSSSNSAPTAPTSLLTEGQTNPSSLVDNTPEFSVIYNDPNSGDLAEYYQIQVDDNSDFTSTLWNSGKTALGSTTTQGSRIADISYSGTSLASSTTYYWRIKFWDDDDAEGVWSQSGTFSLLSSSSVASLIIYDDSMAAGWNNWSYGGTFIENSTEQVSSGTYSIKASYTSPYGALYPRNANLTTSNYDSIEFDMYIDTGSSIALTLGAFDEGNTVNLGYVAMEDYLPGNQFTLDEWNTVVIPLADFNADNLVNEDIGFYFESANTATVFLDNIKLTNAGTSSPNNQPLAPTSLRVEGLTNPTSISDVLPEFSALYNDQDSEDISNSYRIQVDTSLSFSSLVWDSGKQSMQSTVAGYRTKDISYSGTDLATSTTYYWRIKFWDSQDEEGAWSTETATFSIADYEIPENNLPNDLRLSNIANDPAKRILLQLVESLSASGSIESADQISDTASLASFLGNVDLASSSAYASTTAFLSAVQSNDLGTELNRIRGLSALSSSTWNSVKTDILDLQNSNGGFGYVDSAPSDIETTLNALDLFAEVGESGSEVGAALVFVIDQIDSSGRVWYPNGEESSYYLMNRVVNTLQQFDLYNITVGTTTYDVSEEVDLVLERLLTEFDSEEFTLTRSDDITDIVMTYRSFKVSGDDYSWLPDMREFILSKINGSTFGESYVDLVTLESLASSEMSINATPVTSSPTNGASYVIGLQVVNSGLSTPNAFIAHVYVGEYLVGSADLSSSAPEPGETKNYNVTLSSTASRKFLNSMEVRVFLETDDLYSGRAEKYWDNYTATFANNADPAIPALPRWWTVQEHINAIASTTGFKINAELLDDPRRDEWSVAYRESGTTPWTYMSSSSDPAGVMDVTLYGLTPGLNYDVAFGSMASGTLYVDSIKSIYVPYLAEDITRKQPFVFSNLFSIISDYLLATLLVTNAFPNAFSNLLDKTYVIDSLRGGDVASINLASAIAPLRRSFSTNDLTTSTSTPFTVHTFIYPDNDVPVGTNVTVAGLIGGDTLYSDDYYVATPTATDNRAIQYFNLYLNDVSSNEEVFLGTSYADTFDFYVPEELEDGTYEIGMTAVDFKGNESVRVYSSEFDVISNPN